MFGLSALSEARVMSGSAICVGGTLPLVSCQGAIVKRLL
jgi:hypothetical protein